MGFPINPPNTPLVDASGLVTREWYKFFRDIQKVIGVGNPFDDIALQTGAPETAANAKIAEAVADAMMAAAHPSPQPEESLPPPPMASAAPEDMITPYPRPERNLAFDDLTDVEITAPANREYPIYDFGAKLWKNDQPTLDDMDNVSVMSPANGHILIYDAPQTRFENALLTAGPNISIANGAGSVTISVSLIPVFTTVTAVHYENSDFLHRSLAPMVDGTGASVATLNNAPAAGDPTKWVAIDDNGTLRWVPAW